MFFPGCIRFSGVSFSYPQRADAMVFKNFNLEIGPGKVVAFCGPSGGGKSTLAAVLVADEIATTTVMILLRANFNSVFSYWSDSTAPHQAGFIWMKVISRIWTSSICKNIACFRFVRFFALVFL